VPAIFAIDTATERCCLALSRGAEIQTLQGEPGHTHLEHVLPMIERLFADACLRPEQCAAFAFGSGPGSFTGLRVACTIVQGLALATDRPVIALGSLQLLAAAAQMYLTPSPPPAGARRRILAAVDARMQQAYWAVYDHRNGAWSEEAPPSLVEADALAQLVSDWKPDCCAGNATWLRRYVGGGAVAVQDVAVEPAVMARLAQDKYTRGELLPPEQALPAYVRERVAWTVSERRASTLRASS